MKYPVVLMLFVPFVFSCKKEPAVGPVYTEARYVMQITGHWVAPEFGLPPGAHFTTFLGMVHKELATLWKPAELASPGTELLAETGNGILMLQEIDSVIKNGRASSLILFTAPGPAGTKSAAVYCNSNYHHISFASMLGDTPDWFTGLSGVSLYRDNQWISDTTIQLFVYDAGTEEGRTFSSNNPASSPQQAIGLLTAAEAPVLANGRARIDPIATVRFTRQ